ncbi:exopolysaccharide biosynthesis polyprenyl glycosylphosphotransferase [Patescibacteria group bacterium]|nr:exopolysaccharide biosynthesis polyprenyl glycosylphosphotransferase [Patescibacteria group bacterium]MBU1663502.1 exopolysaccharide biosynthesis polyprenyl glycosylphosphotransferase [Patescibacteria group bacterium]MBU1933930.1 exopolysaccharide biosynthesis polyprenyl glycosylphosphotransferase [Patescibacteria group bacterium]MBU2007736.1 exopolysaccharide biosynthesis polyprenyl glycosylphosphotransferase [Patescibacteria group bacterium]
MNNKLKKIFLLGGDIIVLYFSLYLTLIIRYWGRYSDQILSNHFWPFTIIFILWIIIFYISNLYNLNLAINNLKFYQSSGRALIIAGLISLAFFYLMPQINIAPKTNLFIYIIIFAVIFYLWRQFYNWSLKSYLPKKNIGIVGYNNLVEEIINEFKQKPHLGYNLSFIVDDNAENQTAGVKPIADLEKLLTENKLDTVILSSDPHQSENLRVVLFNALYRRINYVSLPNFYEAITGKVPLDAVNQMWFLENLSENNKIWLDRLKIIYDFILALITFIIFLPFGLIVALIIKFESSGPIFLIMNRVGQNNKIFKLIKFRTMKEENNNRAPTQVNDQRITKFGGFLRKTRLDELPQVINILKGEISFVGPRPERPELAGNLEKLIPFYGQRTLVKPGLTGSDQISGEYHSPSREDSLKKLQFDLFYIKNRSVYLDLSILLKTVATVISRSGM